MLLPNKEVSQIPQGGESFNHWMSNFLLPSCRLKSPAPKNGTRHIGDLHGSKKERSTVGIATSSSPLSAQFFRAQ